MRKLIFIPLLLLCTAERCPDALQKIAEGLHDAAVITAEVQGMAIAASANGLITKAVSDQFIEDVTVPVLTAIGHANNAVALLAATDQKDRDSLLEILPPVIESLKAALADDKVGIISNVATQASVTLALQGVLAALNTLQAITEVNTL